MIRANRDAIKEESAARWRGFIGRADWPNGFLQKPGIHSGAAAENHWAREIFAP
jgi:hypothetical protein